MVCTLLPEDPYEYMMNHVVPGTLTMSADLWKQDNAHEACRKMSIDHRWLTQADNMPIIYRAND